ncbi:hypothetical protein ACE02B_20820, partial [Shewanella mangrovisoli]|uniref:hypothetical protein n=1 Tax=Shewanella mangrovisoli TaxID=2864211 RepID=UPI0035BA3084
LRIHQLGQRRRIGFIADVPGLQPRQLLERCLLFNATIDQVIKCHTQSPIAPFLMLAQNREHSQRFTSFQQQVVKNPPMFTSLLQK